VTLPVEHPQFFKNLDACVRYDEASRKLDARDDPLSKLRSARLKAAIGLRLLANYRLPAVPSAEATRRKGLDGFPNYPRRELQERVVTA